MKILSIDIKNLASIDGAAHIDFTEEPLCSTGIFAITGPTGAGKSTILDALCLALYARTPRYLQARETGVEIRDVQGSAISQGDVRAILRDGTADGSAEVHFIGVDGDTYRAGWYVRRARNKAEGSLQNDTMLLHNVSKDRIIPGKKTEILKEIERLIGLNFEQFTRSVLLAQGDFTAFLKAGKDEKSSLLEKLTGTSIYSDISKAIFQRYKDEENKLRELDLQRGYIEVLRDEDIQIMQTEHQELSVKLELLNAHTLQVEAGIRWHERLNELRLKETDALKMLDEAKDHFNTTAARRSRLILLQQVQQTRHWVEQIENTERGITEYRGSLTENTRQKELLSAAVENANAALLKAKTQRRELEEERTELMPLIKKGRDLDLMIAETSKRALESSKVLKEATEKQLLLTQNIESSDEKIKAIRLSIAQMEKWLDTNESRRPIAENIQFIGAKLNGISLSPSKVVAVEASISEHLEAQQLLRERKMAVLSDAEGLKLRISNGRERLKVLDTNMAKLAALELEKKRKAIDDKHKTAISAQAHWEIIENHNHDLARLTSTIDGLLKRHSLLVGEQPALAQELAAATEKKDDAMRRLNNARLLASQHISSLRTQLTAGDACPVCGSKEHPYVTHNPLADMLITQLEIEHKLNTDTFNQLSSKQAKLQAEIQSLLNQLENETRRKEQLSQRRASAVESWQLMMRDASLTVTEDLKMAEVLSELVYSLKTERETIDLQLREMQDLQQETETVRQGVEKQHEEWLAATTTIKDLETNILLHDEKIRYLRQQKTELEDGLSSTEKQLSEFFASTSWFSNWKENPVAFLEKMRGFSESWINQREALQRAQQGLSEAEISRQGSLDLLKAASEEYLKAQNKHKAIENSLKELSGKRGELLGGQSTVEVEDKINLSIKNQDIDIENVNLSLKESETKLSGIQAQRKAFETHLDTLRIEHTKYQSALTTWLENYNIQSSHQPVSISDLKELLQYDTAFIDSESIELRNIDELLLKAENILAEYHRAIQEHLLENEQITKIEILNDQKQRIQVEREQVQSRLTEIRLHLNHNEENIKRFSNLLQAIESQADLSERWAKLNDLIGSADGKKFRQIAQEYTLDILLNYANFHLEMLSKRYMLDRIPNSLSLQIIDQDMGNEVRTVFSLSGGESFLVSLALALGLASLSSNKLKIESLFIDEGFGSLDPLTLNVAMDALERLHNQGRKVGVISHVQEMTERIPVQIRVNKINSGRSMIEVTGS